MVKQENPEVPKCLFKVLLVVNTCFLYSNTSEGTYPAHCQGSLFFIVVCSDLKDQLVKCLEISDLFQEET